MLKKIVSFLLLITMPVMAKETLTVYTYDSFAAEWGPGPIIKKIFEADCQCNLKFVALADGVSLLNRLKIEGKHTQADIILGLDNNLIDAAAKTGLFTKHHVDTDGLDLPLMWNNPYFLPYDYGYFAFVYNSETMHNPPKSLHELVDSTAPWKIIYQDPRTSTPGLGLLLWMQIVYGDDAPAAWQKLVKKTLTVTKGWSEAYGLFLKGEADMVLSYTTSPAYHLLEEQDQRYKAAHFSEGHYLQIEVAGQLASSKQPKLAQAFMRFIVNQRFQQVIPLKNWMYPVISSALPDSYNMLSVPPVTLMFSAQQVAEHRKHWIQSWQRAVSR